MIIEAIANMTVLLTCAFSTHHPVGPLPNVTLTDHTCIRNRIGLAASSLNSAPTHLILPQLL